MSRFSRIARLAAIAGDSPVISEWQKSSVTPTLSWPVSRARRSASLTPRTRENRRGSLGFGSMLTLIASFPLDITKVIQVFLHSLERRFGAALLLDEIEPHSASPFGGLEDPPPWRRSFSD